MPCLACAQQGLDFNVEQVVHPSNGHVCRRVCSQNPWINGIMSLPHETRGHTGAPDLLHRGQDP